MKPGLPQFNANRPFTIAAFFQGPPGNLIAKRPAEKIPRIKPGT